MTWVAKYAKEFGLSLKTLTYMGKKKVKKSMKALAKEVLVSKDETWCGDFMNAKSIEAAGGYDRIKLVRVEYEKKLVAFCFWSDQFSTDRLKQVLDIPSFSLLESHHSSKVGQNSGKQTKLEVEKGSEIIGWCALGSARGGRKYAGLLALLAALDQVEYDDVVVEVGVTDDINDPKPDKDALRIYKGVGFERVGVAYRGKIQSEPYFMYTDRVMDEKEAVAKFGLDDKLRKIRAPPGEKKKSSKEDSKEKLPSKRKESSKKKLPSKEKLPSKRKEAIKKVRVVRISEGAGGSGGGGGIRILPPQAPLRPPREDEEKEEKKGYDDVERKLPSRKERSKKKRSSEKKQKSGSNRRRKKNSGSNEEEPVRGRGRPRTRQYPIFDDMTEEEYKQMKKEARDSGKTKRLPPYDSKYYCGIHEEDVWQEVQDEDGNWVLRYDASLSGHPMRPSGSKFQCFRSGYRYGAKNNFISGNPPRGKLRGR